jgi:hypothetical protein
MLVLPVFRLQRKQHHLCPRRFYYQHQSSCLSECLPCQPCLHLLHLEFCNSGNCYRYRHLLVVFHSRYFRNFLDKDSLTFKRKHSLSFHISVRCPICRCRESTSTCYSSNYLIFCRTKSSTEYVRRQTNFYIIGLNIAHSWILADLYIIKCYIHIKNSSVDFSSSCTS